ncbi:hypothetical protein ACIRPX_39875 [Streptomyces sp. NPDC101225]|uniref:hypothetical protein n=1 Tax=Streptomyces sp. NPDC101225 TaxID=3366135 RepID=UPI0037FDDDF1
MDRHLLPAPHLDPVHQPRPKAVITVGGSTAAPLADSATGLRAGSRVSTAANSVSPCSGPGTDC